MFPFGDMVDAVVGRLQNWNCEYVPHMYVVKGSLNYARWRPPAGKGSV